MRRILVVDDDRNHLKVLKGFIERTGNEVLTAVNVDAALALIDNNELNVIISDLKMPGRSGMDLLSLLRDRKPSVPVIMITGHGDVETAVAAMKLGASDFITKPFDEQELLNAIQKALVESQKNAELLSAYFDRETLPLPELIGVTQAVEQILQTVKKIASTDSTVLITGETGVGKELIAKALHASSNRRNNPFIKVNCAAIPESLAESELFGYERGAFTGAVTSKPGKFELAQSGTIFLDEIGDMPLPLQSRLLTVLQDKSFERVGGVKTISVNVRIIAATNKNLQEDAASGKFRPDLFYRLNVVPLSLPPLRERKEDIVPLMGHFLKKFRLRHGRQAKDFLPEVTDAFIRYDWPGNVRELENIVERMVLMSEEQSLGPHLLPAEMHAASGKTASTYRERLNDIVSGSEKQIIVDALNKTGQNRTKAAELLGISRRTLQNKIKEYGI